MFCISKSRRGKSISDSILIIAVSLQVPKDKTKEYSPGCPINIAVVSPTIDCAFLFQLKLIPTSAVKPVPLNNILLLVQDNIESSANIPASGSITSRCKL